jgi:CBS domain containing-hemolysin-like protein
VNEGVLWLITVVGFVLGAFYSGSETALIACDRIRMRHLANKGNRRARLVLDLLEDPEYFLSVVLVGTNFAVIACTTTFTAICTRHFGARGDAVATVILVPLFLILNEIIPKGLFLYYANRAALGAVYLLRAFSTVTYPAVKFFSTTADFLTRLLPGKPSGRKIHLTMEELLFHIGDSGEAGLISPETTVLAKRAVELKDLQVRDIMVPLDRTVMVDYDCSRDEFRRAFLEAGYSRLPVYREQRQNVVGVLSVHELLRHASPEKLREQLRPPYTVPIDTSIVDVLLQMKEHGRHMAMISGEDDLVVGTTTLENILEKFVGAIEDEFN